MVVAAIVSYFAPSNRGFVRIKDSKNVPFDSFPAHTGTRSQRQQDEHNSLHREAPVTALRRKPLRAMAVLTSIASDFDLISDWCFYSQSLKQDREYRREYKNNPVEGELPYMIPPRLLYCVLTSCILGSIMWLIIATEGRIVSPITTRLGIDKISMGFLLFLSIIVEDIPQIILVFLIEDYYEEEGYLSEVAVMNLMASLYDTCIKMAESFDERNDIVETGVWCKKSITGHEATITGIIVVPEDVELPSLSDASISEGARRRSTSESVLKKASRNRSTSGGGHASASSLPASFRRTSQKPLLVEAFFPEQETLAPQMHFLTTSMDMTAKLWDVASAGQGTKSEKKSIHIYSDVEANGFTCLVWVGAKNPPSAENYFLTGCNNGSTKLWDLSGVCHRSYQVYGSRMNRVASIATATDFFVVGHENGLIRLWQTWAGTCLGQIRGGHDKRVTAIKFVDGGSRFVSASSDATLKLWDTNQHFNAKKAEHGIEVLVSPTDSSGSSKDLPDVSVPSKCKVLHGEQDLAIKKFIGHRGAVLAVACVDEKKGILSGSQDGTARLWSIDTGLCLRVFRGHSDGVYSVLAIDRVTFLTGSNDTKIKAWDALSGDCLRTYEGHRGCVTGLALGAVSQDARENATTFISTSADKSIKCWVLTAVSYRDPAATLDHILDLHENTCQCYPTSSRYEHGPGDLMRSLSPDQGSFEHPYYANFNTDV